MFVCIDFGSMSLPFNCRAPACKDMHAPIFHRRWKCLFYGATSLVDDLEEISDCTNIPVLGITISGIVLFLTILFQVATAQWGPNKNAHSTSKGGKNWNCARMWESGFEVKSTLNSEMKSKLIFSGILILIHNNKKSDWSQVTHEINSSPNRLQRQSHVFW